VTDHKMTAADIRDGSVNSTKINRAGKIVGISLLVVVILAIAAGGMFAGKLLFSTHTVETVEVVTSVPSVCERALTHAEKSNHYTWEADQQNKAAQLATNDYQDAWSKGDTKLMAKLLEEGNDAGIARDTAQLQSIGHWNKFIDDAQACRQESHKAPTRESSLTSRD
jgi:hypothetical protein